jgi:general secretion pathway protein L
MSQILFIRVPEPGNDEAEWLSVDESGTRVGPRQRGPLPLAAALSTDRKVIVVVPGTQVLLAQPELPPGAGARLARAVPFALEEQLSEDIGQLHFALGQRGDGAGTPVAVVSRALLDSWLGVLGAAGIHPDMMFTDASLMPANPGNTVLWLEGERLTARAPGAESVVVEVSPIADALVLAGVLPDTEAATDALDAALHPPPHALLYVSPEDWSRVQPEFDALQGRFETLKVQLLQDGVLPWLARQLPGSQAINLLQGDYQRETSLGARWQTWRLAAMLALGLFCTHVAVAGLHIWRAHKESAALDTEIAQVFDQALPGEKQLDARKQMQARLNGGHAAGPAHFLHTLQSLGAALQSVPDTRLDALAYREQSLDVKVTAPNVDALGQLSRKVGVGGLQADIQSSTPSGDKIDGRLNIHLAAGAKP